MSKVRIEKIGTATLYLGKCQDILPDLGTVSGVFTDPPYCSGGLTAAERMKSAGEKYFKSRSFSGDSLDQRLWSKVTSQWIETAIEKAEAGAPFLIFTDWRQLPALSDIIQMSGLLWRGILVWDKITSRVILGRPSHRAEYALFSTNGTRPLKGRMYQGVWSGSIGKERVFHPCAKPTAMIEEYLDLFNAEYPILDPFMGSGSTGVACVRNKRFFIGIEADPKYFEIACRRMEEAYQAVKNEA